MQTQQYLPSAQKKPRNPVTESGAGLDFRLLTPMQSSALRGQRYLSSLDKNCAKTELRSSVALGRQSIVKLHFDYRECIYAI